MKQLGEPVVNAAKPQSEFHNIFDDIMYRNNSQTIYFRMIEASHTHTSVLREVVLDWYCGCMRM